MNLLDIFEGREPHQQAIDKLEQRRIEDLEARMDDCARRGDKEGFQKCKAERDSYYRVNEAGIGHDIADKAEKIARATPPTKTGAVASTVKNAAKWLAGKGGPGREGPTYEGAEDIENRGEYDQEGNMAKDNIHTIVRNARELESILSDNDNLPEWVQDKLANIKGMMTAVSEYMQTQHERDHEEATGEEGIPMPEGKDDAWSKESDWKAVPKSKSGKPVDPRGEVTHLSDVARRKTEKTPDQKKNSEEVDEGYQDFNKVEPYAVCLAGKPVKKFDYYEDARRFHDNWKKKLYNQGEQAKADKITLLPLGLEEGGIGDEIKHGIKGIKRKIANKPSRQDVKDKYWGKSLTARSAGDNAEADKNAHRYATVHNNTNSGKVNEQGVAEETREAELNRKFNTPEQLKKDADYRAYRKGVKASRKQPPAPLPEGWLTPEWPDQRALPKAVAKLLLQYAKQNKKSIKQLIKLPPVNLVDVIDAVDPEFFEDNLEHLSDNDFNWVFSKATQKIAKALQQQGVAEGTGPQSKLDQKIIHLLTNGIPADAIARKLDIPVAWVDEVAEYNMPDSAIDYNDPRNTPPTNRFGEGVAEGSFAHDQLKGEINDLFKPVVLQIVKWARAEGMTAKDLAGTSSHFFLDALDPDTYDRTQHLPDNYFNKLMDKANAKAVEILKKKGVAESATAPIIVPKRRIKAKPEPKFDIPYSADDYVPPALAMASAEALDRIIADPSTKETTRELAKKVRTQKKKGVAEEKTRLDPKCWKGKKIGTPKTKVKGGVRVNNCVPAESVEEEWSKKYKDSINCSNPKGFSQKAHCAGKKKNEGMFSTLEENNEARDAVESAIVRRIMVARTDLLKKFGPQKVMDAAQAVADDHSDVEEIGTSDVSAFVHQVERYLAMNH